MSGTRIAVLQGFAVAALLVVAALLTVAVAEHELAVCVISNVCFICCVCVISSVGFICRVGAIDLDVAFALDFAADYFCGEFVYELFLQQSLDWAGAVGDIVAF